ncbi:energy-coupling factor ABC transporter ATP-binding protein [Oceanobacillus jeddahense]|uniref:ATP-binding cassette domain-containing protein n=1 Tax=Oceanobacillus jeddahense TaxID=1462527 RepID=A0ABY5JMQ3_9BACI|nr:ATP-binding cassette domain-containing protein [Oceanobacillus jeddahense]UUI01099.1 ATP-binding cassette domain-containing protein [Oceanobacillus jeddahense]
MNEIKAEKLQFSYTAEKKILQGIHLHLMKESTAIIGQNGAGKSTFVKLLKGLLKPTAGSILYNGKDISGLTAATLAKDIGMVFQNPNDQIFKNKVIDEVMFGPQNIGQTEDEAQANAITALRKVGLEHQAEQNPYDLSLSERKMIAVASILAMNTNVVIFDEPTMGQDYVGKQILKNIIAELRKEGKLVLCILHDMDFAAQVFERTIVFHQGNVLLDGPTKEVFMHADILKKAFLEQPSIIKIAKNLGIDNTYLTEEELIEKLNRVVRD